MSLWIMRWAEGMRRFGDRTREKKNPEKLLTSKKWVCRTKCLRFSVCSCACRYILYESL